MTPSLEEYRTGQTTWKGEHRSVSYTLSHWGISSYQPQGIWNYYIHLLEEQFVNPADFALFNKEREIREWPEGSFREAYDYYAVPDLELSGGITYYSKSEYVGRDGKVYTAVKLGCDYNHSWNADRNYPEDKTWVERDAKHSIDYLLDNYDFALKERCVWSGKWDISDNFYTAKNGARVHKDKLIDHRDNPYWSPVEEVQ
jgi:hypothetical protein